MQNNKSKQQEESLDLNVQEVFLQELKNFLSDPYYVLNPEVIKHPGWQNAVSTLIEKIKTLNLCINNDILTEQTLQEIEKWTEYAQKYLNKHNPYIMDQMEWQAYSNEFSKLSDLDIKKRLQKFDLNKINFYDDLKHKYIEELEKSPQTEHPKERLKQIPDLIKLNWEYMIKDKIKELSQKQLVWETETIPQLAEGFSLEINQKFEKLQHLKQQFSSLYSFLGGGAWDYMFGSGESIGNFDLDLNVESGTPGGLHYGGGPGFWKQVNFDTLDYYAKLLEGDEGLKKLAEIMGRYRQAEKEFEEEYYIKLVERQEWKPSPIGRSEIVGVTLGDNLHNMIVSQVALLKHSKTKKIFIKNLAEKKLLEWQFAGQYPYDIVEEKEEIRQVVREEENRGPIIVCVDTSGSMAGKPEQVAKTITFALLSIALREKRKCYLISFSSGSKGIDLTNGINSINDMISFLKMSFYGGNDDVFLKEAVEKCKEKNYKNADVLVVSDFIHPPISNDVLKEVQKLKSDQGTKFHSLMIGYDHGNKPRDIYDNEWIYDSSTHKIKNITKQKEDTMAKSIFTDMMRR